MTSIRSTAWIAALAAGTWLLVAGAPEARAQGFGVYEQGTCAMGRAGAAVADPCEDGSAIFFNPGALVLAEDATIASAGATALFPGGEFRPDDGEETSLDTDVAFVPHAYLVHGVTERASVGIGVFAPYGLETRWPKDFEGRFLGYDNRLNAIYVQPSAAWRLDERIAVGGGPTIVIGSVELNRRLDLSTLPVPEGPAGIDLGDFGIPPNTDFADLGLEADGAVGLGAHVGLAIDLGERLKLGTRYMSPVELEFEGDADFTRIDTGIPLPPNNPFGVPGGTPIDEVLAEQFQPGGPFDDGGVATTIELPAQWVVGLAFEATSRVKLHGDVQWTGWSSFDRLEIGFDNPATPDEVLVENYDDTITTRLGAEVRVDPVVLRGGWIWNEAAAPDETVTPLLPEGARNQFTTGITWPVAEGWTLDAGYQLLLQKDRRGRVDDFPSGAPPTTELNSGEYGFHAHLVGITVQRVF